MRTTKIPTEILNWQNAIGKASPSQMSAKYSSNAILLPTYDKILKGTDRIEEYFDDFLDKQDMKCRITKNQTFILPNGYKVSNGYYVFSFVDEGDNPQNVLARYTYVTDEDGKIITHHSSEMPDV